MNKFENYGRIVCAALLKDNCIYMGIGHHTIFPMEPIGVLRCAEQGFVTENGFFVDRKIALEIAKYYNQIDNKYNPMNKLVSEDLKSENLRVKNKQKEYTYKEQKKGILMKFYDREQAIYEIISLLKYHSNDKNCLRFANLLINKASNERNITLSVEEIKEVLFESQTGEINIIVLNTLKHLHADLTGISFAGKKIEGINFSNLEGVVINLEDVPEKNLTNINFNGVTLTGTLDNAKLGNTNFKGYIGDLKLDPQKILNKNISSSTLAGITIDGSFDDVVIRGVDFTDAKGDVKINPQRIPGKELMNINFSGVKLVGDNEEEPSFEGCEIYSSKFNNLKNKVTINLDVLDSTIFPKLAICDLTDVTITGKAKSNYEAKHCVREDGRVLFEDVNDDLYGGYYYDEKGNYVHVHLYESMRWDTKNQCWEYIPREEESNIQIEVQFKEQQIKKEGKSTIKQKIKRKLGLKK